MEHRACVDMRHIVVLGQLLRVEALAREWFAEDGNLEGLQVALLAEFVLHLLDICSEATLAEPFEVACVLLTSVFFVFGALPGISRHKECGRLRLYVEEKELAPVKVQLKWGAGGMHRLEVGRNVDRLHETCANALRDGLDQSALARFFGVIDTKDVLSFGFRLKDFLDHTS
jgi:hypothetical protein